MNVEIGRLLIGLRQGGGRGCAAGSGWRTFGRPSSWYRTSINFGQIGVGRCNRRFYVAVDVESSFVIGRFWRRWCSRLRWRRLWLLLLLNE